MRQRYYNPEIKRFINQDIITGSIGNSQSLNRYCYVQGNPVSMTDPFGLFPLAFNGKELLHAFLNVAGMAPGILGTMADVANAAMYAMEGDVASAISCGISALPAVGNIIAGGMLAVKGGKALKTANYVRNICGLIGNGATFLRSGAAAISGAVDVVQHYIETGDVDWAGIGAVGLNMFAAKLSASAVLSNGNSLRKMLSEDNVAGKIKKSFGNAVGKFKGKSKTNIASSSFGETRLEMNLQYFASESGFSDKVLGGRFKDVDASRGVDEVGHHMPQNAYDKIIGISRSDGPALLMSKEDHALTRTFAGRGKATMREDIGLSARQRMAKDLWDIKNKFGKKYNEGIKQMLDYAKTLPEFQKQ